MVTVQVQGVDGKYESINISEEQLNGFSKINEEILTKDKIKTYIDNMDISAEVKVFLNSVVNVTFKIGFIMFSKNQLFWVENVLTKLRVDIGAGSLYKSTLLIFLTLFFRNAKVSSLGSVL